MGGARGMEVMQEKKGRKSRGQQGKALKGKGMLQQICQARSHKNPKTRDEHTAYAFKQRRSEAIHPLLAQVC